MVYEERVEQVPVRVCRQEAVVETVGIPRVVTKKVPVTYTYRVPRTIVHRIPIDEFGNPIPTVPAPVISEGTTESAPPAGTGPSTPTAAPEQKPQEGATDENGATERPTLKPDENVPEPTNNATPT
jgi:hypothetical protein